MYTLYTRVYINNLIYIYRLYDGYQSKSSVTANCVLERILIPLSWLHKLNPIQTIFLHPWPWAQTVGGNLSEAPTTRDGSFTYSRARVSFFQHSWWFMSEEDPSRAPLECLPLFYHTHLERPRATCHCFLRSTTRSPTTIFSIPRSGSLFARNLHIMADCNHRKRKEKKHNTPTFFPRK